MTNPLIPYTFTPGSKARAQEVNANFIAVAEGIDSNRQFTLDEVKKINTNVDENISKKDLSNTTSLTNVILEAPNGVAGFDGTIITVKAGLRVLIPNGRSSDGTFKNIDYKFETNKTFNLTDKTNDTYYFGVKTNGSIVLRVYKDLIESEQRPDVTRNITWYDSKNNYWYNYTYSTDTWEKIEMSPILGTFQLTDNTISNFEAYKPYKLLDNSKKREVIKWLLPDYSRLIQLTSAQMTKGYTVPTDGYFICAGSYPAFSTGSFWCYVNDIIITSGARNTSYASTGNIEPIIPVSAGDIVKYSANVYDPPKFAPMKGV